MKSISKKHFKNLYGKKIAVDTNIYMYKFIENNELIENFYFMIALFQYYNIKPIFIFDGKIDKEKIETINRRKEQKFIAEEKYNKLLLEYNPNCEHMIELKKQFTRVPRNMFSEVKTLITLMGETYIDAPCEADELCSWLVISNQVYGCLSEDTDMFVYGCNNVYKNIDLDNQTLLKYDLISILRQMNISKNNFIQLCVISDNDYNNNNKGFNYYYHLYRKYKKYYNYGNFYDWLILQSYNIDYDNLIKLSDKFNMSKVFDIDIDIKNKNINKSLLKEFLKNYNFIFL
tara:strand:+ start:3582 stop:4445 length:864 start_codon:yes stop_codon:yes gene_type:complete